MCRVTARRTVWLACVVAVLHGAFFIWYQRPDWRTQWADQEGYSRLATALATTGRFTPYPDSARFIPEVIRTPVYPAFLAVVYKFFGQDQLYVAAAQTGLFVMICLLVFAIARRVTTDRIASVAALATALFPPIPYFGALVMTEVFTTLLFTASIWFAVRTLDERDSGTGTCLGLGVLSALTTLSRPAFILFPILWTAIALAVLPLLGVRTPITIRRVAIALAAFAVVMLPWFAYNYVNVGRFTLSPAGGLGRGTWEGSWQATWPGRLQAELTGLAENAARSRGTRSTGDQCRRPRTAAARTDARVRAPVERPSPDLGHADRSVRAHHGASGCRSRVPRRRSAKSQARWAGASRWSGWLAARSSCGPEKFRFDTATSTGCRRRSFASAG